ncbi:MAG TPA: hypothetical protein VK789_10260 [Bryobacteraceae bacterium]|nr:hypothetical protein [Bryobacteraceae bacterium]
MDGANIDFTDAVAQDYLQHVRLRGILGNWVGSKQGSTLTTPAGLPAISQVGITNVADGQTAIAAAAQSWNDESPLFIAIGVDAWNMNPTDVNSLVSSLGAIRDRPRRRFIRIASPFGGDEPMR